MRGMCGKGEGNSMNQRHHLFVLVALMQRSTSALTQAELDLMCGIGPGVDGSAFSPMGCGNLASVSGQCIEHINGRMHTGMAYLLTCDAEVDFVRGMIPHHQAAIDMCLALLKLGNPVDPALRLFCVGWISTNDYLKGVIPGQQGEIAQLFAFLAQRGVGNATLCPQTAMSTSPAPSAPSGGHTGHGRRLATSQHECGIHSRIIDFSIFATSAPRYGVSVAPQGRRLQHAGHSMVMACGDLSCRSSQCFQYVSFEAAPLCSMLQPSPTPAPIPPLPAGERVHAHQHGDRAHRGHQHRLRSLHASASPGA